MLRLDVVSADVLRDAASFARHYARVADVVEERGLAVVDVTHHGHHGGPWSTIALDLEGLFEHLLHLVFRDQLDRVAKFFDHQHGRVLVKCLVDRRHHAHPHQRLDDFAGLDAHALREFADRDHIADLHFPDHGVAWPLECSALLLNGQVPALGPPTLLLHRQFAAATAGEIGFRGRARDPGFVQPPCP